MKNLVLKIIRIYQKSLSADHGFFRRIFRFSGCRFYPSCSEYACRVIDKHGLGKGLAMAAFRILKCNPFSGGGVDLPN